eukprot:323564-Rhodomonas_salina.1
MDDASYEDAEEEEEEDSAVDALAGPRPSFPPFSLLGSLAALVGAGLCGCAQGLLARPLHSLAPAHAPSALVGESRRGADPGVGGDVDGVGGAGGPGAGARAPPSAPPPKPTTLPPLTPPPHHPNAIRALSVHP